ncbi:MAG: hypothetical protein ACRDKJ_01700 [Actinomycetota bacterium]
MTLLLLGLGAGFAAVGTRAAALPFVAAAVFASAGSWMPAMGTWAAATALGFVGLRGSPRRLALPVLGAAAALGVGSARNTAVVGALWVLGTVAAVVSRGGSPDAGRWALTVCAADVPFLGAVVWTAGRIGFQGWPLELDGVALILLLTAAAVRAPLASGPQDSPEAGLLPVRVQTFVVLGLVLGTASPDRAFLVAAALVAGAGFALGGTFRPPRSRDAVQEAALVALVLSMGALGWVPLGWEWAALAGGTLIHHLRLRLGFGSWGSLAAVFLCSGGVLLPFLPSLLVGLEGSLRADDLVKVGVPLALLAGLVARSTHDDPDVVRQRAPGRWELASAAVVVCASAVASLWAPIFTIPSGAAADGVAWPPAWSVAGLVVLVLLAGTAGGVRAAPGSVTVPARSLPDPRLPARWAGDGALVGAQAGLGAVAVGVWVLGTLRGFL